MQLQVVDINLLTQSQKSYQKIIISLSIFLMNAQQLSSRDMF